MSIHRIETEGGVLAVEVEGNGPLVICAPGLGDTRDAWVPVAAQLRSNGYTTALMDVRGHGDSTTTFTRYGDAATAEDFILIIEKLNKGPAVLAGDSFSAGSATIAAGKRPELVNGVVLCGPFLRNPVGPVIQAIVSLLWWKPWGPTMWKMYSKTLWPGLGDKVGERAAKSTASLTRPGHWAAFQSTFAGCDHSVVAPWLEKASTTPALVVMGSKDPDWSDPLKEAEWAASNFKTVESLTVHGAGHAPMLENPEVVGNSMLKFLNGLKSK